MIQSEFNYLINPLQYGNPVRQDDDSYVTEIQAPIAKR
jgi:hypothetical protein